MTINPEDYITQPNNWFETEVSYEGMGRAEFESPAGYIEGPTTVTFDETGNSKIQMVVENVICETTLQSFEDKLYFLLSGHEPVNFGSMKGYSSINFDSHSPCSALTIKTSAGTLHTVSNIHILSKNEREVVFYVQILDFQKNDENDVSFWVMPLTNFVSKTLNHRYSLLLRHPLRVFPPPSLPPDLSVEDKQKALVYAKGRNCFIPFIFNDEVGFVERLIDYHERSEKLENGSAKLSITAVMIGSCANKPREYDKVIDWLPWEYLHLLSLSSGSLVGVPWVEFRSESGDLVRRIHIQQWQSPYFKGHRTIDFYAEEIRLLLLNAPSNLGPELRTAIRLFVKGSQSAYYLEDQLTFMCRAADALTASIRNSTEDVDIPVEYKERILEILQEAEGKIKEVAGVTDGNKRKRIERIARVVLNAWDRASKRPDQAESIVELAEKLSLKDFSILNKEMWMKCYKKYRNQVIHKSYLPENEVFSMRESIPLYFHLGDLLLRIILKKLGYEGQYNKFILTRDRIPLDWITEETEHSELWYKARKEQFPFK